MSIQIDMEENAAFAKEIDGRLLAYNQEHSDQFRGKWRPLQIFATDEGKSGRWDRLSNQGDLAGDLSFLD